MAHEEMGHMIREDVDKRGDGSYDPRWTTHLGLRLVLPASWASLYPLSLALIFDLLTMT
jgi:hypothetical protein